MKTYQFKVKLLSDIILNKKAASTGNQATLDFIPGGNFLGIVASNYKSYNETDQLTLFHSSKVRFGDAHPLYKNRRALRSPASFQQAKNKDKYPGLHIHHKIRDHKELVNLQLKQQRDDFYIFNGSAAVKVSVDKNFAIKSAYDREKRRSEDEKIYGYQSMQEGTEFCFELNVDDDVSEELMGLVVKSLVGKKRVGRSRTAQYGLVEIKEDNFEKEASDFSSHETVAIYAESRLLFLDANNNPTLTPSAKDFGFADGEIDWANSQIRTFAYSSYNYQRASFDAERKGIEKGSVIVVRNPKFDKLSEFVGVYQNEGFGKVLFNPTFFDADEKGLSTLTFKDVDETQKETEIDAELATDDKHLYNYLKAQKDKAEAERKVYNLVNQFVKENAKHFKENLFASQWGTIRSIAMQYSDKKRLEEELFTKETERNNKTVQNAYLTHGVAKKKWDERGRRKLLENFLESVDDNMAQFAIINLSSEMAKKCRRR